MLSYFEEKSDLCIICSYMNTMSDSFEINSEKIQTKVQQALTQHSHVKNVVRLLNPDRSSRSILAQYIKSNILIY